MGKIYCEICRKKCKGDVLKLDQKFIHKSCFNCHKCNKNLEKGGFFCRDDRYYCTEDYQKQYGIKCGMCNKYVDGEVVTILGGTFHIQCFQCQNCNTPFTCGDKATLWDGTYMCQKCALAKQEKENMAPALHDQKSITESDFMIQATETPITIRNLMINPYDSSDTEGPVKTKPKEYLQLHIENGYTSTDSGVEKTKSELGYMSQHSPCYSISSGDESWMRSSKGRKIRSKNNYTYGRYLNPSYLEIKERITKHTPPNAVYCGSYRTPNTAPITSHFHRPVNPVGPHAKHNHSGKNISNRVPRPQSTNDVNLSEEVKRLAHYPDGKVPEPNDAPPIDRYDFPAPPSASVIMQDLKREKLMYNTQRSIVSTGDIFSDTLSGTDTAAELGDFPESEDEKSRKKKVELTFKLLRETGKYSGLSQSMLDEFEKNEMRSKSENFIDPVSASRSPDASREPPQKPRYERHTFTSPSRDNRYEGRPAHSISYRTQYSNTGGRTGTLPSYRSGSENESAIRSYRSYRSYHPAAQPGYTQGYMSCTEEPSGSRQPNGLNYRAHSLPRPLNMYTPICVNTTNYLLDGHMSPSMTTSGYSVDATTHSIDESTLIGGSGILTSTGHRNGYMSDLADSKKSRPDWYYESENDAVFHSNYPTVQSYLKPSNMLRTKQKAPAETYPYEKLKISNFSLPKGVDRSKLEDHLSSADFELVFQMTRLAFSRLPEWKRNDIKQKVDLY